MTKIRSKVKFPTLLDMKQFVESDVSSESASSLILGKKHSPSDSEYQLRAVIVHHGNAYGGEFFHALELGCNTRCSVFALFQHDSICATFVNMPTHAGHYTTYALLDMPSGDTGAQEPRNKEKRWMHFSDEKAIQVAQEEVLGSEAYMLFYDKA